VDALAFKTLKAVAEEQDADKRQVLMDRSNAALGAHFMRHPGDMEEVAYDLLNNAWSDAQSSDIIRDIIEVKTVGLGEPDYVDEDLRGLRAYFQGKGGQILSDVLRYERSQMPREEMATAIDLHAAQIDPILEAVANRSKGNVTIVGSRQAVRNLANIGLEFSNEAKERVLQTGNIGIYKGYNVVEVENFEDFAGNLVLPTDELWVVGQNAGRLTYYGRDAKVQQLPRPAFYVRWETARDAGMLLYGIGRGRLGRIKLT
jgi:hypothetical protein